MKKLKKQRGTEGGIRLSYRQKIMTVILTFTLCPLLIFGFFFFERTLSDYRNAYIRQAQDDLAVGAAAVDKLFYSSIQKVNYIKNNKLISAILTTRKDENLSSVLSNYQNASDLFAALSSESFGSDITIYTNNPYAYNGENIKKVGSLEDQFLEELKLLQDYDLVMRPNGEDMTMLGIRTVNLYSKVESAYNMYGIIEITIPFVRISEIMEPALANGRILLYTDARREKTAVLSLASPSRSTEEELLQSFHQGGVPKGFYRSDAVLEAAMGSMSLYTPNAGVIEKTRGYLALLLSVILAIVVVLVFSVRFISYALTRQLTQLVDSINAEQISSGEIVKKGESNEFDTIYHKIDGLAGKIKEVYSQIANYEVERRMLEVDLLQANINPHFLYNTLSAIKWTYPDKNLSGVIDSLVKFYRIALNKGNNILKIAREVDMIREYIRIQQFAYQFYFEYTIHIEEQALQSYTLKNLLQPIVENAVLHGIRGRETGGVLTITGSLSEDKIHIFIDDNGIGIEPDRLTALLDGVLEGGPGGGYGLRNVHTRIKTYYGPDYGLAVQSTPGVGTRVTVTLPYISNNPKEIT